MMQNHRLLERGTDMEVNSLIEGRNIDTLVTLSQVMLQENGKGTMTRQQFENLKLQKGKIEEALQDIKQEQRQKKGTDYYRHRLKSTSYNKALLSIHKSLDEFIQKQEFNMNKDNRLKQSVKKALQEVDEGKGNIIEGQSSDSNLLNTAITGVQQGEGQLNAQKNEEIYQDQKTLQQSQSSQHDKAQRSQDRQAGFLKRAIKGAKFKKIMSIVKIILKIAQEAGGILLNSFAPGLGSKMAFMASKYSLDLLTQYLEGKADKMIQQSEQGIQNEARVNQKSQASHNAMKSALS